MRCFRAPLSLTLRDRVRNDIIRERLSTTSTIIDVIRGRRLAWFGYVFQRSPDNPVHEAYTEEFNNMRPLVGPQKDGKIKFPLKPACR